MYSRNVNDQLLTFGVSGKLTRNTLIMYDRETDSLWPQIIGEAVEGPLTGSQLEFVGAVHTTWAEWSAENPTTVALVKGYSGNYDNYDGYYESSRTGVIPETHQDERLYAKEFVIGVELPDDVAAYPYSVLNNTPVVNDDIGSTPVVVTFSPESGSGVVFNRQLDGETLTFSDAPGNQMTDDATNSRWDTLTGVALDGPREGQQLEQIKSTRIFWFGWKDWYPNSRIYGLDA